MEGHRDTEGAGRAVARGAIGGGDVANRGSDEGWRGGHLSRRPLRWHVGRLSGFLERADRPSALGGWSYDVVDTKLARAAKGGALLQVLLYADLVAQVQGTPPEYVRLALAGPDARIESFRVAETAAYFRSVKRRFLEFVQAQHGLKPAPDPVEHCAICDWGPVCKQERREADHLSQVAGITSGQRRALVERDITTLEAFAEMPLPITPKLESVSAASLERMHAQALIQLQGRRAGAHKYELLQPVVPEQGLAALPEPSAGDLFFDLEGDPFAHVEGLEYLFGYVDRNGAYHATWALNPDDEKRAFEEFVDFVMARLEQHPDLHIYHFNHYETTALKRLMSRHGTREDEIDRLLRGRVFVDLFRVVRQGLRASVESYSIKKLEPLYGYTRDVDLRVAGTDKANFEAWLEIGGNNDETGGLRASIEGYNRDDCVSTLQLRDWLEEGRRELASLVGEEVPRPAAADPAPDEEQQQRQAEVDAVMSELMANISADAAARTPDEHARWLLAQLLEFHRREKKPYWWSYYHRLTLSEGPCSHGPMLPCSWGRASRGTIASPASTPAAAGV
ncbi:MAG: TM0106 family RecB-like putative nuclease [Gemmatimonadota bacterium]